MSRRRFTHYALLQVISKGAWFGPHLRTLNDHRFIVGVP